MSERLSKQAKVELILRTMKDLNKHQRPCEDAHYTADRLLIALIKHLGPNSILIDYIIDEYNKVCKWYSHE